MSQFFSMPQKHVYICVVCVCVCVCVLSKKRRFTCENLNQGLNYDVCDDIMKIIAKRLNLFL